MEHYHKVYKALDEPMEMSFQMKAVSKQRPRTGRSGHMYTPKETRAFEKMVAEKAATLLRTPYTCPVAVFITVYDPIPSSYKGVKRQAAEVNLISPPVGDLDNKVKAVTDALNGIAYVDDKQINFTRSERLYGENHAILVTVQRNGLSLVEVQKCGNGYGRQLRDSGGCA